MYKLIRIISVIIVYYIINVPNSLAQLKDSLTTEDYGFQIRTRRNSSNLPSKYVAVKTVKLSKPLYPQYKYRVRFFISSRALPWNKAKRSYSVMLFPDNFPFESIRLSHINKIVKSREIMPKFTVGGLSKFFSFTVEPDTTYRYLTIGLEDNYFSKSNFDIASLVKADGIFVKLLGKVPDAIPTSIAGRKLINKGEELIVTDSLVTLEIYDHKEKDGDIVSIYLNEKLLVKHKKLTKRKKKFHFTMKKNQNIIVLHADNLGYKPPNTAAIIIKTKNERYEKHLSSNLHQSEYIKLIMTNSKNRELTKNE